MVVRLSCGALQGVDAFRVDLEVDFVRQGLPSFVMVGLAEGAVREAKERVFACTAFLQFSASPFQNYGEPGPGGSSQGRKRL